MLDFLSREFDQILLGAQEATIYETSISETMVFQFAYRHLFPSRPVKVHFDISRTQLMYEFREVKSWGNFKILLGLC